MFIYQILGWSNESRSYFRMAFEEDMPSPLFLKMSYTHFNQGFTLNDMDITHYINSKVDG